MVFRFRIIFFYQTYAILLVLKKYESYDLLCKFCK